MGGVSTSAGPSPAPAKTERGGHGGFQGFLVGLLSGMVITILGVVMWMHRGRGQTIQPQLLLENQRVRIVRWILQPDQSTATYTDHLDHINVIVRASTVRDHDENGQSRDFAPKIGDAAFEAMSNRTHTLANVGKTTLELVSIELK